MFEIDLTLEFVIRKFANPSSLYPANRSSYPRKWTSELCTLNNALYACACLFQVCRNSDIDRLLSS